MDGNYEYLDSIRNIDQRESGYNAAWLGFLLNGIDLLRNLRSVSLAPEVGSECSGCGARVAKVFELSAGSDSMRGAWKDATAITGRFGLSRAAS
jgi:hypothetical protein